MAIEDLLLALRDIQAPADPGWWPLAPGWWVLILIIICAFIAWFAIKQRNLTNYFQLAEKDLKHFAEQYRKNQNKQTLALNLSRWLRQTAILAYPDQAVAGLTGAHWVSFLDDTMPAADFSSGQGDVFGGEIYSAQIDFDADAILSLCTNWLKQIKPELSQ